MERLKVVDVLILIFEKEDKQQFPIEMVESALRHIDQILNDPKRLVRKRAVVCKALIMKKR